MEHKEYRRINSDSDIAILFIHGVVGTPNHFSDFVSLVPKSFSVCNLLLDGHGKSAKDFSHSSMKKWERQVSATVEELSLSHKEIYIVAHSMGTLLAIEQAVKNKSITKMFLLAVPLKLSLKYKMFLNSLKVYFNKIRPDDPEALAAKKCYGIENNKNPLIYFGWIPRFFELFTKIRQIRKIIKTVDINCTVYQSKKDEMVSLKSIKYLKQNSCISLHELKNSGHYYYAKEDFDFLITEFNKILNIDTWF